jgi:hypothetical protein
MSADKRSEETGICPLLDIWERDKKSKCKKRQENTPNINTQKNVLSRIGKYFPTYLFKWFKSMVPIVDCTSLGCVGLPRERWRWAPPSTLFTYLSLM